MDSSLSDAMGEKACEWRTRGLLEVFPVAPEFAGLRVAMKDAGCVLDEFGLFWDDRGGAFTTNLS